MCFTLKMMVDGLIAILKINLECATFAIKTLHKDTEQLFKKEWEILKQFSGLNHPHLITALSAFRQAGKLNFIFPYARSDFERHKEFSNPPQGRGGALWIAAQLEGLIGAIDTMHNPKHLHRHLDPTAIKKYCRHSDIKCDNVLCFRKAGTKDEVILVISDFGLSEINSDKSRSNIPNQKVPPVPGYRPPECDIEGGTISRAFDIWTIGCLFLELVTWFLGGPQYVKKFEKRRTTPFINGSKNNIFFSFKNLASGASGGTKAILVKPEVTAVSRILSTKGFVRLTLIVGSRASSTS
jgi:serine/threonine protein kinase